MKTQFKLSLLVSVLCLIAACTNDTILTDDSTTAPTEQILWKPTDGLKKFIPQEYLANIRTEDLNYIERELRGDKPLETRRSEIHIAANTTNKLASAIAAAQYGEVIVLDPGDHFETGTVVIDRPVGIEGYGANLIFSNTPATPDLSNIPPAIHIKSGGYITTIRGITFKGLDTHPGNCIFIDQAEQVKIINNDFQKWQFPIIGFNANYATILKNTVLCDISWSVGAIPESDGITFSGGHHISIIENTVTDGLFGIFTGGSLGIDFGNKTSGCLWGQILCKATGYVLGGTEVNTTVSTNNWLVMFNTSENNFESGYLVIDGAHKNLLEHNKASGNSKYDIELTGDSHRFGFLTPKSFDNRVHAYSTLKVKDCGDQNKVYGGIAIDTALDPCN